MPLLSRHPTDRQSPHCRTGSQPCPGNTRGETLAPQLTHTPTGLQLCLDRYTTVSPHTHWVHNPVQLTSVHAPSHAPSNSHTTSVRAPTGPALPLKCSATTALPTTFLLAPCPIRAPTLLPAPRCSRFLLAPPPPLHRHPRGMTPVTRCPPHARYRLPSSTPSTPFFLDLPLLTAAPHLKGIHRTPP